MVRVDNTTNRAQLAVESLDDPTSDAADGFLELNGGSFPAGSDIALRMVIDAENGLVTGFYSVDGATEQQVSAGGNDELIVPAALQDGVAIEAGLDPTVNAGLFATKRAAAAGADVSVTFADFAVTIPAPANTPPTVTPIDDVDADEGTAISPIAVTTADDDGDTVAVTVEGLPTGLAYDDSGDQIIGTPVTGSADVYTVTVTADDGTDVTIATFTITVAGEAFEPFVANINFNAENGEQPAGYALDYGLPFGDRDNDLTYGWVDAADGTTPLDLTGGSRGNGRDRGTVQADQRLDSLVHMQGDDITVDGDTFSGVDTEGVWEIEVPNGTYEVTVAAGDSSANNYVKDPEEHALNVEGTQAIAPFVPVGTSGADLQHRTGTVTVTVTDGFLTIDADGGTNTKIDYIDVERVQPGANTPPEVRLSGDRTLFVGQDTIIPVDAFDEDGDTLSVNVSGLPDGLSFDGTDIVGTIGSAALAGTPFTVEVTADDGEDPDTQSFEISVIDEVNIDVNFQDEDFGPPPAGYLADFGQAFGPRTGADQGSGLSYGWVAEGTTTPLSLEGNARERGRATIDDLNDTLIHMQYGDIDTVYGGNTNCDRNQCDAGAWEIAVPDGLYEVTLSVGDQPSGGVYDSLHAINIESGLAILEFQAEAGQEYLEVTAEAGVQDGRLSINAIGGANTKLGHVQVRSLGTQPFATEMIPPNRATDVALDSAVSASVSVPGAGVGVDPDRATSLTDEAVKLFQITPTGEVEVEGSRGSTGGNDTIAFSPDVVLEENTTYRYVIDGVLDEAGNTFGRFESTFTTGEADDDPGPTEFTPVSDVQFERVVLPTASGNDNGRFFTSLQVHQGFVWATTIAAGMQRYEILADGTLGPALDIPAFVGRAAIGLVFDEDDPNLAWVTHATADLGGESSLASSTVSVVDLSTPSAPEVTDVFVGLPRSLKDHLSNSIGYGPSGDGGADWMYFLQGSNQAAGDIDNSWGTRGETQLTAALLRFDPQDALAEARANGAIDVTTEELGGTYDPFAPGADLEIYATGIRNAYDFVWHSNGSIYVPTNGTAAGGRSPGVSFDGGTATMSSTDNRTAGNGYNQGTDVTDECATRRIDGQPYTGPDVPAAGTHPTQLDFLFDVEQGGYYGHPNPTRCEWVLNNGSDNAEVGEIPGTSPGRNYPAGVAADPNYDVEGSYSLGFNKSPNGVIEYQSDTFGGQLDGRLMIIRFSNNNDVLTMQVANDGSILGGQPGSDLNADGFDDPLEIIEDPATGNLYVNQYNRGGEPQELYLLRVPDGQQAAGVTATPENLVMSATLNGEQSSDVDTISVTNTGTDPVAVTQEVTGTDAADYTVEAAGTIDGGATVDLDVTFDPNGSATGSRLATVTFDTGDGNVAVDLRGLAFEGQFGGQEPTLQEVSDLLQLGIATGWSGLAGGHQPERAR